MAGGKFDKAVGKVRPGTYTNFESDNGGSVVGGGSRGTAIIPLPKADYGPAKQFIKITTASPDAAAALLGHSVYDEDKGRQMLLLREALKRASTVYAYILCEGEKAKADVKMAVPADAPTPAPAAEVGEVEVGVEDDAPTVTEGTTNTLTAVAKYGGSRGNAYTVTVDENPVSGFDVLIHLDGTKVGQYEGLNTIEELIALDNPYVTFSGEGKLGAAAGTNLAGGTDAEKTNGDVTAFIEAWEQVSFNTVAFPFDDDGLKSAAKNKIKYMRESMGKGVQVVLPDGKGMDYEGVLNVTNSVELGDLKLTHAEACAWVAGATAGASKVQSLTQVAYDGATAVVDPKSHDEAVAAIKAGEFFFSVNEEEAVVVEYDINSLTTYGGNSGKDKSYTKNRVIRTLDALQATIQTTFPPNKYDNDPDDWDVMDGVGKTVLKEYLDDGAIKNVDYDNDFLVDRETSQGDETYFIVAVQPVDSSEKLYFSIKTR